RLLGGGEGCAGDSSTLTEGPCLLPFVHASAVVGGVELCDLPQRLSCGVSHGSPFGPAPPVRVGWRWRLPHAQAGEGRAAAAWTPLKHRPRPSSRPTAPRHAHPSAALR